MENQEKLQACEKCIVEMNCLPAYAPILHPNFMGYPTKRDTIGNTRLSRIMKYLYRKGYELKGKKIIDIGAYYSFLHRLFKDKERMSLQLKFLKAPMKQVKR